MDHLQETMAGAIVIRLSVGPLSTNCYLVQSGRDLMLVDPGLVLNRELIEVVTLIEETKGKLRWIVCTHGHVDHVSGADAIVRQFPDAVFAMDPREAAIARDPSASFAMQLRSSFVLQAVPSPLAAGQEIAIGTITYRVATIAGHTAASTVLIASDHAFVGDTLFAGSIGRTSDPASCELLVAGIRSTILSLPPATRLFPGHGMPTTVGQELATNPWF